MLDLLGRSDIPLHRGLRGRWGTTDDHDDAARAIIRLAHEGEGPLHVISIGAESNLALALHRDPSIAPEIRAVFIDGDYPWAPALAYNVPNDVEAFQSVLDSGCSYLHVPAPSVSGRLSASPDLIRSLFPEGDAVGRYLRDIADAAQAGMDARSDDVGGLLDALFGGKDAPRHPILWDIAAIAAVARPELTTVVDDGAPLFEADDTAEWSFRVTPRPDNPRRIRVVSAIDVAGIWEDYRRTMLRSAES